MNRNHLSWNTPNHLPSRSKSLKKQQMHLLHSPWFFTSPKTKLYAYWPLLLYTSHQSSHFCDNTYIQQAWHWTAHDASNTKNPKISVSPHLSNCFLHIQDLSRQEYFMTFFLNIIIFLASRIPNFSLPTTRSNFQTRNSAQNYISSLQSLKHLIWHSCTIGQCSTVLRAQD